MVVIALDSSHGSPAPASVLRWQLSWLLGVAALTGLLPLVADPYWVRVAVFLFINIGLASTWNIIGGVAGYPSFGQVVFFSLGAYTTAILMVRYGVLAWIAVPAGGIAAAAFSLLFLPLLRLRGLYFALSTFAAALAAESIIRSWIWARGLKGIEQGWNLPDLYSLNVHFYITLALLVACLASIIFLLRSRVGLALRAIHKDEIVAACAGVNCTLYKTIAFVFSSVWPGIFGGVYALFMVYISVETVFDLSITLNMIVYTVFGGIGTVLGPIVGGLVLSLIDQLTWTHFLDWHSLIYGALVVLIVTYSPGGVLSWFDRFKKRRSQ